MQLNLTLYKYPLTSALLVFLAANLAISLLLSLLPIVVILSCFAITEILQCIF